MKTGRINNVIRIDSDDLVFPDEWVWLDNREAAIIRSCAIPISSFPQRNIVRGQWGVRRVLTATQGPSTAPGTSFTTSCIAKGGSASSSLLYPTVVVPLCCYPCADYGITAMPPPESFGNWMLSSIVFVVELIMATTPLV